MQPIIVYLDQNAWIKLARTHYGLESTAKNALAKLRRLIDEGKVVTPLSCVHIMETATPSDPARRERLARFMVELSHLNAIPPMMAVRKLEVTQSIKRELGFEPALDLRRNLVRPGLAYALGCDLVITSPDPEIKRRLECYLATNEAAVLLLAHGVDRKEMSEINKLHEEDARQIEQIRRAAADVVRRALSAPRPGNLAVACGTRWADSCARRALKKSTPNPRGGGSSA